MPTFVDAGNDLFDVMVNGQPDHQTRSWLEEQSQAVANYLGNAGQSFIEHARGLYNVISDTDAAQVLRNLSSKMQGIWTDNSIRALHDMESVQTAGPTMQRWVMANKTVRQHYLNQEIEGYSGSYENQHGRCLGEDHFDWRQVMSGVVQTPPEEDYRIQVFTDPLHGADPLTVTEKVDILNTWELVERWLEDEDEDPTSPSGNPL